MTILTIEVCEARGRASAPARARTRIPGVRYPGGNGAGAEGKKFYRIEPEMLSRTLLMTQLILNIFYKQCFKSPF